MTATHQEEWFDQLRVLWFFIELNMLFFIMISRHRTEPNTCPASITTAATAPTMQLITSDIRGYRKFTRVEPAFFILLKKKITPRLRKSTTNFKKPLEVGLKLAVTLRHLSTGETYT